MGLMLGFGVFDSYTQMINHADLVNRAAELRLAQGLEEGDEGFDDLIFIEECTLAEHQLLKRIRQLCHDPDVILALVETLSRDSVKARPLPRLSREAVECIDKWGMDV